MPSGQLEGYCNDNTHASDQNNPALFFHESHLHFLSGLEILFKKFMFFFFFKVFNNILKTQSLMLINVVFIWLKYSTDINTVKYYN